jgi:hypothetical protein
MICKTIQRVGLRAIVATSLGFYALPGYAVELWGIMPATNQIVRVNPTTGAVFGGFTPPGGAMLGTQMFGGLSIAEHGAVLLYQNPAANPTSLFRINPDTGALISTEFMPAATNPEHRAGLSFASGAGAGGANAIFAINDGEPVQRQDGYGDATLTNHSPTGALFAGALGGDDNGRHFLAAVTQFATLEIREFDPATPNLTINTLPLNLPMQTTTVFGLAFDGQRIYLSHAGGTLLTIDPDTGAVLHSVVAAGGASLIGLAARGVPEPGAATLAIAACVTALGYRRHLRQTRISTP